MMELMVVHPHIFWLSLGGLLLAAEMLGGNGYLLWSGVAAVITGLVVWLVPLGWEWQGVNGRGHMRVGDSSWPVSASEDLGAGTHVEVIAIEGITLIIRAVIA